MIHLLTYLLTMYKSVTDHSSTNHFVQFKLVMITNDTSRFGVLFLYHPLVDGERLTGQDRKEVPDSGDLYCESLSSKQEVTTYDRLSIFEERRGTDLTPPS